MSDETDQGSMLPKRSVEIKLGRAEFLHAVANSPGVSRILVSGALSIVVVLVMAVTGHVWISTIASVVFLFLFTLERVAYVTIRWCKDAQLEEMRKTCDNYADQLNNLPPSSQPDQGIHDAT